MTQDELTLENGNGWDVLNIAAAFERKGSLRSARCHEERRRTENESEQKCSALRISFGLKSRDGCSEASLSMLTMTIL